MPGGAPHKFSSSVEYLRWRPSFLECRWVSPGGCHRAERVLECPKPPTGPPGHVLLRWLGMWLLWGFLPRPPPHPNPGLGSGVGGDSVGAGPDAGTVFHCEFQFWCGGTGSHRMVFNRGRAEISSIFSSSKTMHMNTSKSPNIPEGIQCHFEKLVPLFYVLLL